MILSCVVRGDLPAAVLSQGTLLTSARASERPVRAHSGAMTRLLFPEALLWLPSSSRFLPVTTRAPFPSRLYTTRSLQQLPPLMKYMLQASQGWQWQALVRSTQDAWGAAVRHVRRALGA